TITFLCATRRILKLILNIYISCGFRSTAERAKRAEGCFLKTKTLRAQRALRLIRSLSEPVPRRASRRKSGRRPCRRASPAKHERGRGLGGPRRRGGRSTPRHT